MGRTFIRQETQIRKSDTYDDTISPSATNYETNPIDIEDDLNTLRSQINNFLSRDGTINLSATNWYDDLSTPGTFEFGKPRGINKLNTELHELERKRVLTQFVSLTDVFVSGGNNFTVLAFGELPTPNIPNPYLVASGSTSILTGTVAASGSIGTFSLNEVAGATAISPKNLCTIVTGSTRDPLLSSGRTVYGLFQTDKTDGQTLVGGDAQLSFVRLNAAGDDLEAVPFADVENKVINYASVTRKALEDLSEQDFLRGAEIDVPSAQAGVTRQNAYDNQGATAVTTTTNATLNLGTGFYWQIGDADGTPDPVFTVTEGSTGGTTTVAIEAAVDFFDVNAVDNDFSAGVKVATAGTDIHLGVNAGVIETTATDDLRILGAGELFLDDGNQPGSWAQTSGIKLSDAGVEWSEFESAFGEVSLLKAISDSRRRDKVYATVSTTVLADNDVSLAAGNIDVALPYMNSGSFLYDYDVYLNGEMLRPGANSGDDHDYYPGTTELALKFEFPVKLGDVICVVPYVRF